MEKEDYFSIIQRFDQIFEKLNIEIEGLRTKDANFEETLQGEKDRVRKAYEEKYKIEKGLEYVEFQLKQKEKKIKELLELAKE